MISKCDQIKVLLQKSVTVTPDKRNYFFKTGVDSYAAHDQFMGVTVPAVRIIAKQFFDLSLNNIQQLLKSSMNEERLLALIILVAQYQKTDDVNKEQLYQFYMNNLKHVNNWNLVDASAHWIVGAHLLHKKKDVLCDLSQSSVLWERRIAIVSTLYFIRNNDCEWTFKIALLLLKDTHDLIHKAVGWMLREAGKKNISALIDFLDQYAKIMPRTMLRYAIEKFPEQQRKVYLQSIRT